MEMSGGLTPFIQQNSLEYPLTGWESGHVPEKTEISCLCQELNLDSSATVSKIRICPTYHQVATLN
jgi:hypothetical protein